MPFLADHPLVLPVLLLLLPVWLVLAVPTSRLLGCGRAAAAAIGVAATAPLAMTLLPSSQDRGRERECSPLVLDPSQWGAESYANLVLLLPLALLATRALPPGRAVLVLLYAGCVPFVAEAAQFTLRRIGRECDLTDLALNLTGLAVGSVVGLLLRRRRRTGPDRLPSASRGT